MPSFKDYQLVLFDFDGLLVNTEQIHFQAYINMCANRGFTLDWDFKKYCSIAHYEADTIRHKIYAEFPKLYEMEPLWEVLYAEKKQAFLDLVKQGAVHLMPGIANLLDQLNKTSIKKCVVTHSAHDLVAAIRKQNPLLETIPHWLTREHYSQPKPHPECYHHAIERFSLPGDRIIGFEDTPRGINALKYTQAQPVLICQTHYPEIPTFVKEGIWHFPSFDKFLAV